METHTRSIIKALSWRFIATLITTLVALFMTGTAEVALKIGALDFFVKLAAYYFHERAWIKLKFGKMDEPEYQI